jgi:hypothetical protein
MKKGKYMKKLLFLACVGAFVCTQETHAGAGKAGRLPLGTSKTQNTTPAGTSGSLIPLKPAGSPILSGATRPTFGAIQSDVSRLLSDAKDLSQQLLNLVEPAAEDYEDYDDINRQMADGPGTGEYQAPGAAAYDDDDLLGLFDSPAQSAAPAMTSPVYDIADDYTRTTATSAVRPSATQATTPTTAAQPADPFADIANYVASISETSPAVRTTSAVQAPKSSLDQIFYAFSAIGINTRDLMFLKKIYPERHSNYINNLQGRTDDQKAAAIEAFSDYMSLSVEEQNQIQLRLNALYNRSN